MADVFTAEKRSVVMSGIRSKNTKPEVRIRKGLHGAGLRYRLHVSSLPGKPDIVLAKYNVIVQVRGCFWHGHTCHDGHVPKSRRDYWLVKLARNAERDRANDSLLRESGWAVFNVWECECASRAKLAATLERLLVNIQRQPTR